MANKRSLQRTGQLQVRVSDAEKEAFAVAAKMSGLSISDWVRQMARKAAISELRSAGHTKTADALTR